MLNVQGQEELEWVKDLPEAVMTVMVSQVSTFPKIIDSDKLNVYVILRVNTTLIKLF